MGNDNEVNRVSGPTISLVPPPTLEDQVMMILNDPRLSMNERAAKLKKEFGSLSESDAKELWERLNTKNSKDSLSLRFHKKFPSDAIKENLMNILKGKFEKSDVREDGPISKPGSADVSARKGEKGIEGTVQEMRLKKLLADPGSEALQRANQIVQDKSLTFDQKKELLQKCLENAPNSEVLKKLVVGSKIWPKEAKEIFNSALAGSEKAMNRIGAELPFADQEDVVNQLTTSKNLSAQEIGNALGAMFLKMPERNFTFMTGKYPSYVAYTMVRFSPELRTRFSELPPNLRKEVIMNSSGWINELGGSGKEVPNLLSDLIPPAVSDTLREFSPKEKNELMKRFGENGLAHEFVKYIQAKDLDDALLKGLTLHNAELVKQAFDHLRKYAPNKDLEEKYNARFNQVDYWIKTHFSGKK